MFSKKIIFIAIFLAGTNFGYFFGFSDGADLEKYNRETANLRLQQCLRIIKNE